MSRQVTTSTLIERGVEIEQSELRELRRKVEIEQRRGLVSIGSSGRRLVTEVPHGNG